MQSASRARALALALFGVACGDDGETVEPDSSTDDSSGQETGAFDG